MKTNRHGIPFLPVHARKRAPNRRRAPPAPGTQSKGRRALIWERDNGRCHYCGSVLASWKRAGRKQNGCGKPLKRRQTPPLDHKTPRALGGENTVENLVLCCLDCNSRKGDQPYELFLSTFS